MKGNQSARLQTSIHRLGGALTLLDGRVAIISGIGPGMGRDAALACAREGARVVLAARTLSKVESVAAEVESLGGEALAVTTDVTDLTQIDDLVASTLDTFGRVDVLVNNAFAQPPFATLEEMDLESWYSSFEINCTSALKMSRAVLPSMRQQGKGSIINVATMSIRNNKPMFGAYAAAKSAMTSMTRTMAKEVGPDGVRVNAICPGFIFGDSVQWYLQSLADQHNTTYQEEYDNVANEIALGFIPDSEQICGSVVFFASDLSIACTGTSLDVNGGHFMTF
ncbi:MAG: short-chain dehydrogenase [Acidimicrobiaceae bacterium]|nr:short-chain dehydrogenase [Acidimicrobiaceae bacterium]